MAAHGRQGEALETYRRRKLRPHKVSGLYWQGEGGKPVKMSLDAWLRKKRHKGSGKAGDSNIIHYQPYRCVGRARTLASL